MAIGEKVGLEARVRQAAEAALAERGCVNAIDLLIGMRLLDPNSVDAWRKGRVPILEERVQGGYEKISKSLELFRRWAEERGLQPSPARYLRTAREGEQELQITGAKYAGLEEAFRMQYVSPGLSAPRKKKLEERLNKPAERVAFLVRRDSACSECGVELSSGSFLYMDGDQPLCLACAGMGDLEFLGRGDTALTRRATKYSPTHAVVVEFSRSRGRYERQGILVTEAALRQAEEECAADAPERADARAKAAVTRQKEDAKTVEQMTAAIGALFPGCPPEEARHVAEHTAVRGSGRVGRSAAGRRLDRDALTLAVRAAVRHRHTKYDELLAGGIDRTTARDRVRESIDETLDGWRQDH